MNFGSVCSGIEAASVAWHPLGWKAAWLAEIEPFPCAVLAHHYPSVPNLGDMTTIIQRVLSGEVEAPDVFTGGTPCQAFSVAGKRGSLADARGNLSLTFCEIANAIDDVRATDGREPCIVVWENVPGVLSTADNAFGCFLGALAGSGCELQPAGGRWTNAGLVLGPRRAVAWRIIDAQYFGLAQRRRRVFVVASARDGFDPAAVLFEFDGVRRDCPPSREAREGTAPSTARSVALRGREGGGTAELGEDCGLTLRASSGGGDKPHVLTWPAEIACTLNASFGDKQGLEDQHVNGGGRYSSLPSVSMCLNAGAMGRQDAESETLIPTFGGGFDVAHSLRGEGFDASEDGTGRGTPLVHVAMVSPCLRAGNQFNNSDPGMEAQMLVAFDTTQITSAANYSNPKPGDPCHPLAAGAHPPAVAFTDMRGDNRGPGIKVTGDIANTLHCAKGQSEQQAVAWSIMPQNSGKDYKARQVEVLQPLMAGAGQYGNQGGDIIQSAMAVRRLTPRECERLQGFPTVTEKLTIDLCFDHQSGCVDVVLSCRRWQNNAFSADGSGSQPPAHVVAGRSATHQAENAPLAALHVLIGSEPKAQAIHSRGRLMWSANGAGHCAMSHPSIRPDAIARALAPLTPELAKTARDGKAGSPASIRLSFPVGSGSEPATQSGGAIAESASDVESGRNAGMFTTSDLGRLTPASGTTTETLCCSALAAIAGCIPSETLPECFSLEVSVESPYTLIPWRNKPASECPDGPRYKALGNSWAVPCARWIGQRIQEQIA